MSDIHHSKSDLAPGELGDLNGTLRAPQIDTREISIRPGFGLPARGYRLAIDPGEQVFNEGTLQDLVTEIQRLAIENYQTIDFGGSLYITEEGQCIVQGEFAPNRYSGFENEDFNGLIDRLKGDLQQLGFASVTGGLRNYSEVTPGKIESVVGIEPGYKGQDAFTIQQAKDIVFDALDNVSKCQPGVVFYSYLNGDVPVRCSEPIVIVEGTTSSPDDACRAIALGLKQTSLHAVIGVTDSAPIHQAYKVSGELTAREIAHFTSGA